MTMLILEVMIYALLGSMLESLGLEMMTILVFINGDEDGAQKILAAKGLVKPEDRREK